MSDKIQQLRELVFAEIKRCLAECGHCKSYEGRVSVVYPNYFEQGEPDSFAVELACYLIGPTRHYRWTGNSIDECCDKAIADVEQWITERSLS